MRTHELALSLSDLATQFCLVALRGRRRPGGLKEIEFLTLLLIRQHEMLNVGNIQRHLRLLAPHMSRIIRSLEGRHRPLIARHMNPHDKRKIDVALTEEGMTAVREYQKACLGSLITLLSRLGEKDRDDLQRLLDKLRSAMPAPLS